MEKSTHGSDENEHGLVHQLCGRKETQPEVDEDEILRQLRQHPKHVPTRPLSAVRHVVVRIMLERDSTKEERHNSFITPTFGPVSTWFTENRERGTYHS